LNSKTGYDDIKIGRRALDAEDNYNLLAKGIDKFKFFVFPQRIMSDKNKAILWEELKWKDIEKLTTRMKMLIIPHHVITHHVNSMVHIYP
jgi:hypothetical protein